MQEPSCGVEARLIPSRPHCPGCPQECLSFYTHDGDGYSLCTSTWDGKCMKDEPVSCTRHPAPAPPGGGTVDCSLLVSTRQKLDLGRWCYELSLQVLARTAPTIVSLLTSPACLVVRCRIANAIMCSKSGILSAASSATRVNVLTPPPLSASSRHQCYHHTHGSHL